MRLEQFAHGGAEALDFVQGVVVGGADTDEAAAAFETQASSDGQCVEVTVPDVDLALAQWRRLRRGCGFAG